MVEKKFVKWKVLTALSIIICITLSLKLVVIKADESDTWILPKESSNERQKLVSTEGEYIIQEGIHRRGTSTINYRTTGMYMTIRSYDISKRFNYDKKYKLDVRVRDEYDGDEVKTTYRMLKKDFFDGMQALGVTSQMIKNNGGSITVYIHNIFEIYNPQKPGYPAYNGYDNICGYQEILEACERLTGGAGWSPETKYNLQFYYNFPYVITPTLFNVEVVAATTNDQGRLEELQTLRAADTGVIYENFPTSGPYTAPDTIKKNGVTYKAKGYWFVRFTRRTNGEVVQGPQNQGLTIKNYTLPDAAGGSTVKIYVAYEKEVPTAKVIVNAVDMNDNLIKELTNLNINSAIAGKKYTITAPTSLSEENKKYKKTKNYYYRYTKSGTNSLGAKKTGSTDTGTDPIEFTVPEDVKSGSDVILYIYYEENIPSDIRVNINLVDKSNDKVLKTDTGYVKGGDTFQYSISQNLYANGKNYTYTGKYEWFYELKSSNSKKKDTGSGTKVSFTAPSADKMKGDITVNIYYSEDPPSTDVMLRVIMVNSSGNLISEISSERVVHNQSISKTTTSSKSVNGIVYNYLNKWDYVYITASGSNTVSGTGKTAAFKIPNNAKTGSTVTLRFYYSGKQEVEVPEAEAPITLGLDTPAPYGIINGDPYNSPYFDSKEGISTTESQHVYVKTKDYLLGYTLVNRTGKITYNVPVTKHYILQYYTATPRGVNGGPKLITKEVEDTQIIPVERAYSYWEISNIELYYVYSANIYNYSLPDRGVSLSVNASLCNLPSLYTWHSSSIEDHVIAPPQVSAGIDIPADAPIVSETSDIPKIEYEDLTSYAYEMTEEVQVRNDYLSFHGSVVMSNQLFEKISRAPDVSSLKQSDTIIPDKALYTEKKVIDALKLNGKYASSGTVTYVLNPYSINASNTVKQYSVSVNDVTIHTPVICNPIINADNSKWTQLINPAEGAVQIVLDEDTTLNDFEVTISNTLEHSVRLGYYTRDFSRSFIDPENVSYIAKSNNLVRNEMKLPFDVYMDVLNDKNPSNDKFIKAGTWIVLGRSTSRFYVPMWVQEGIYTAEFRTVAVNGTDKLTNTEAIRNSYINNYVATSKKTFEISGRIYGLYLYDISDYPNWESVFRVKDTMLFKLFEGATDGTKQPNYNSGFAYYYSVGTNDQYGKGTGRYSKYTVPLVNGSHPKWNNLGVLKTGYAVRFMLDTVGEMYSNANQVKIIPTFYYVDSKGKNRQQVDLYYQEEFNGKNHLLVKVGEGKDLANIQSGTPGNIYSRIPEAELRNTAAVMNTSYSKLKDQISTMYSYSIIRLLHPFRTFIGTDYANNISSLSSFTDVKKATGLTKLSLSKYHQRWYGTYKLPTDLHVAPAGYDVAGYMKKYGMDFTESFWLKDGYIIVNFNIVTIDKNGKERLSYINGTNYLNKGNCSMWVTEGAPLQKTDYKGTTFNFKAGDFIIYYTDKKYSDDYTGSLYQ